MLNWKIKKVNDIETNPLDCYWAVGYVNTYPRLFTIVEQYPSEDGYTIKENDKPELYVLFESLNIRDISNVFVTEEEVKEWKHAQKFGNFWANNRGIFIRAFKTLEEAKARAEIQISSIQNVINHHF